MKKLILLLLWVVVVAFLPAQEQTSRSTHGVGVHLSSDGMAGILLRTAHLELALKLQAFLYDADEGAATGTGTVVIGAHGAYVIPLKDHMSEIGIGMDVRTGLGTEDVDYDEYIDAGPFITFNRYLSDSVYISGNFYPFWVQTRDVSDVEGDWSLTATIPRAALGVGVLF